MRYILRHKDIDVARLELEADGFFVRGMDVLAPGSLGLNLSDQYWVVPEEKETLAQLAREKNMANKVYL